MQVSDGLYTGCSVCTTHICCKKKAKGYITPPWITQDEMLRMQEYLRNHPESAAKFEGDFTKSENIYTPAEGSVYGKMVMKPDGDCVFCSDKGCIALDARPFDCRVFPYELLKKDGKLFFVRYTSLCPSECRFDDDDVDSVIALIVSAQKENIWDYAMSEEEISEHGYVIIKEIEID